MLLVKEISEKKGEKKKKFNQYLQMKKNLENKKGKIRVLVRIREEGEGERTLTSNSHTHLSLLSSKQDIFSKTKELKKNFYFERVFNERATQSEIFNEVDGLPEQLLNEENICLLAYGATGTGKTYSLLGDRANPGLLFRCLDNLHQIIRERRKKLGIRVKVSEIYLENVRNITNHSKSKVHSSRQAGLHRDPFEDGTPRHLEVGAGVQDLPGHGLQPGVFPLAFGHPVRTGPPLLGGREPPEEEHGQHHLRGPGRVREI